MYELLTGLPPNFNDNKAEMYSSIMNNEPLYPAYLTSQAVSLMKGLLQKNPEERLGYWKEFEEVKEHEFFRGVDWSRVLAKDKDHMKQSPVKPRLDRCYFDQTYVDVLSIEKL